MGAAQSSRWASERADAVYSLLRFGFAAYEHHDLYPAGQKVVESQVFKGAAQTVSLGLSEPIALVMAKGLGKKLKAGVALTDPVLAPVAGGQVLGTLTVTLNDDELLSRPLVALQAVEAGSWMTRLSDTVRLWFH